MTALITNGSTDDTGNVQVAGPVRVIASGNFSGLATVVIELEGDSLNPANIHNFNGRGAIRIDAANLDIITATIRNGDSNTSIDVTVTVL